MLLMKDLWKEVDLERLGEKKNIITWSSRNKSMTSNFTSFHS